MKKSLINLICIFTLLLSCCITANAFVVYMSFSEMIVNADNIGYYKATQVNSTEFKLNSIYNIKGESVTDIYASSEHNLTRKLASGKESNLMFIQKNIKTGKNNLIGIFGNTEMISANSLCKRSNIAEMENVISKISDLHKVELSQRINEICELFKSEKLMVRFAALDYSNSRTFNESIPQYDRSDVGQVFCAYALDLIDDKEPDIRRQVLKLLLHAPSSLQLSMAPKYLTDPDSLSRQYARTAIKSAAYNNKISNYIINRLIAGTFKLFEKNYNMEEIQNECKKVLDSRPDIKEKDIKYLDKSVKEGKITKQTEDIFLNYMK